MKERTKRGWRWFTGLVFVAAGINHFLNPEPYLLIMPDYLPAHPALVQISGVAEILGGLGVLFESTRPAAAWGLILLLIAVFPANISAAQHGWPGANIPKWVLWGRLPLQAVFIGWVYRLCIADGPGSPAKASSRP